MIEKEKVLSGLHCRGQDLMIDPPACDGCRYHVQLANRIIGCDIRHLCRDAIALLQEQEAEISKISNAYLDLVGKASKQPEIIRCKDCKHRPKEPDIETYESGFDLEFPEGSKCPCQCEDGWYSWYPKDDWFCANGIRKDS